MRGKFQNRIQRNRNAGFSFVELIVVIVITLVLASALTIGVSAWIVRSNFEKQNNYARTLFAAAQNQLTEYEMEGTMSEFCGFFSQERDGDGLIHLADSKNVFQNAIREKLTGGGYEDDDSCLSRIWKEADKAAKSAAEGSDDVAANTSPSAYRGSILSVLLTAQDYEKYVNKDSSLGGHKKAVYDLFQDYLYDPAILRAPLCVEFSPEAGMIFSVFYSEYATGFHYDENDESTDGIVDICDRGYQELKSRMVGYYGVSELGMSTSSEKKRPVIGDVQLTNEDTLNLRFNLAKVSGATGALIYDVTVYDSALQTPKLMLRLTNLKNENFFDNRFTQARVYYPKAGQTKIDATCPYRVYPVMAWIDKENYVNLVLDAADLLATSESFRDEYALLSDLTNEATMTKNPFDYGNSMANSFSFHRFGVDTENIYCTVQGHGSSYQTTSERISNIQNTYFDKVTATKHAGTTDLQIEITNARHLYNMRYLEDLDNPSEYHHYYPALGKLTFRIAKEIRWEEFGELYDSTQYYAGLGGRKVYDGGTADFPSMKQLRRGDVLEGKSSSPIGGQMQTITGLSVSSDWNRTYLYPVSSVKGPVELSMTEGWAGLILQNYGTIQNLTLDQIRVSGEKNVGAFCGVDSGDGLTNLTVGHTGDHLLPKGRGAGAVASLIEGTENVGGVAGLICPAEDSPEKETYQKIVNYARVCEAQEGGAAKNLGGIVGLVDYRTAGIAGKSVQMGAQDGLLSQNGCYNYGQIFALSHESGARQTEHIGGVAGKCDGLIYADGTYQIRLYNCKASPLYDSAQVTSQQELKKLLNGWYVGGIVGYNSGAAIVECNTTRPNSSADGYVLGDCYVGGIVGFNEGENALLSGLHKNVFGVEEITDNQGLVCGNRFVGGIIGYNPEGTIIGWRNTGFVGATEEYAGGSAGANGYVESARDQDGSALGDPGRSGIAKILKCTSNVENNAAVQRFSNFELFAGASFVGGMTGYNDGSIIYDEANPNAVSGIVINVSGKSFVGGIVGYNDVHSLVSGFAVGGGSVRGKNYVGGYAGFNGAIDLLMNETAPGSYEPRILKSNPNLVLGDYCVGGTIGANIVPTDRDIRALFSTSNFLGYVGCLNRNGGSEAKAFVGGFIGYNQLLAGAYQNHKTLLMNEALLSAQRFDQASAQALGTGASDLAQLEACLPQYTGAGIPGLSSPISASSMSIMGESGVKGSGSRFGAVCGQIYVGGVLGYNEENSTLLIRDVVNMSTVKALGFVYQESERRKMGNENDYTLAGEPFTYSYAGGVLGRVGKKVTIDNCSNSEQGMVSSLGTYTGAICEINDGTILHCSVQNIGSNTMNYVGGIAGVNGESGLIESCVFDKTTVTGASFVGGIVAENFGTIRDVQVTSANVVGTGQNVGGLVGYNYQGAKIESTSNQFNLQIQVSGDCYVGGIAGKSEEQIGSESGIVTVSGAISADRCVGGAVGQYLGTKPMLHILNRASVTATNGNAGGIAGQIQGKSAAAETVRRCVNLGTITASKAGNAGGIVAENQGKLVLCGNRGEIFAPGGYAGGIAGSNRGEIRDCQASVAQSTDANSLFVLFSLEQYTDYGKNYLIRALGGAGGIAGINAPGALISGSYAEKVTIQNLTGSPKDAFLGGIAGWNQGTIENSTVSGAKITSYVSESHTGGVAGRNTAVSAGTDSGVIRGVAVRGTELGLATGLFGNLGGAAGKNEKDTLITNVSVQADVFGEAGKDEYGYGGIAGVNFGRIEKSRYSAKTDNQSTAVYGANNTSHVSGEVHGLAGNGSTSSLANIGGIAGRNEVSGVIEESVVGTDFDTAIIAGRTTGNSANAGGIAGYNYGKILACDNYQATKASGKEVIMVGFAGQLGGIVGECAEGGVTTGTAPDKRLTTGQNWKLYACYYSNNCGIGGIIGHSFSGADFTHVDNWAQLNHWSESGGLNNRTIAGIVARFENHESDVTKVVDCNNYGDINGNTMTVAAGLFARVKYKSVSQFQDCSNYGRVTGWTAAGIQGDTNIADDKLTIMFDRCANYGDIVMTTNSGVISGISIVKNLQSASKIYLMDCVNVGNLILPSYYDTKITLKKETDKFSARVAGISARPAGAAIHYYLNCVNYGNVLYSDNVMVQLGDDRNGTKLLSENCVGIDYSSTSIGNSNTDFYGRECLNLSGNLFRMAYSSRNSKDSETNYGLYLGENDGLPYWPLNLTLLKFGNDGSDDILVTEEDPTLLVLKGKTLDQIAGNQALLTQDNKPIFWDRDSAGSYDDYSHEDGDHHPSEGYRQRLFEEIQKSYREQLRGKAVTGQIKITSLEQRGSALFLTWSRVKSTWSYQRITCEVDGEEIEIAVLPYNAETYRFDCGKWDNKEVTVRITALDADLQEGTPSVSAQQKIPVKLALPVPKVHMELTGADGYRFVLENPEDFAGFENAEVVAEVRIDNNLRLRIDRTIENVASGNRFSEAFELLDGCRTYILSVYARDTRKEYAQTSPALVEAFIVPASEISSREGDTHKSGTKTDFLLTTFYDGKNAYFEGALPIDFAYCLRLAGQRSIEANFISDLVAKDYLKGQTQGGTDYHFDVAVSSGETYVAGANQVFDNKLGDLPEALWALDEVRLTARTYLWQTYGRAACYGHVVENAQEITAEKLEEYIQATGDDGNSGLEPLLDRLAVHVQIEDGNPVFVKENGEVVLNQGYQLRLNKDGTYTIFFSALFADERISLYNEKTTSGLLTTDLGRMADTCDFTLQMNANRQPMPDIRVNVPYLVDDELYVKSGEEYVRIRYQEELGKYVAQDGRQFPDTADLYIPYGGDEYHLLEWDQTAGYYVDGVKKHQVLKTFNIEKVRWNQNVNSDDKAYLRDAKMILAAADLLDGETIRQSLNCDQVKAGNPESIDFYFTEPIDLSSVRLGWSAGINANYYRKYFYNLQYQKADEPGKWYTLTYQDGEKAEFVNVGCKHTGAPDYMELVNKLYDPVEEYLQSEKRDLEQLKDISAVRVYVHRAKNLDIKQKEIGDGGCNLSRVFFKGTTQEGVEVDTRQYAYAIYDQANPRKSLVYLPVGTITEGYYFAGSFDQSKERTLYIQQPPADQGYLYQKDGYYLGEHGCLIDENGDKIYDWNHVSNGSSDVMKIVWDQKGSENYAPYAVYAYTVWGTFVEDGEEKTVLIDSGTYETNNGVNTLIYPDTTGWRYHRIEIAITRGAKTDAAGRIEKFARTGTESVSFIRRLSQISMPMPSIINKNEMLYQIDFANIPREERAVVAGYEITVRDMTEDPAAGVRRDDTRWNFRYENGGYVLTKSGAGTTVAPAEGMETAPSEEYLSAVIDLQHYNNCVVEITIRAIAAQDCGYRDGAKGVPATLSLTRRLAVPRVKQLARDPIYMPRSKSCWWDRNTFRTWTEFYGIGQKLTYTAQADEDTADLQARYELAVAIYPEKPADADSVDVPAGVWNDGALYTLAYKEGETDASGLEALPLRMNGDLAQSSYQFYQMTKVLPAKYAGYWMKIAMRAVSDSNVSSYWSDEDEAGASVNYAWIQIPRLQLSAPITQTENFVVQNDYTDPSGATYDFSYLRSRMILGSGDELGGSFLITSLRRGSNRTSDVAATYRTSDTDWIYLQRKEDGVYEVYYATTDPESLLSPAQTIKLSGIPELTWIGTLDQSAQVALPYELTTVLIEMGGEALSTAITSPVLTMTEKDGQMQVILELPDIIGSASATTLQANPVTDELMVQTISDEPGRYENSQIGVWYDGLDKYMLLEHHASAPAFVSGPTVKISMREGYRYEIGCQNRYPVLIEVTAAGHTEYLTCLYGPDQVKEIYAFLPDEWFAAGGCYEGVQTLYVRMAQLTDTEGLGDFGETLQIDLPGTPADLTQEMQTAGEYESLRITWDEETTERIDILYTDEEDVEHLLGSVTTEELLEGLSAENEALTKEWTVPSLGKDYLTAKVILRETAVGELELIRPAEVIYRKTPWGRDTKGQKIRFSGWEWKKIPIVEPGSGA